MRNSAKHILPSSIPSSSWQAGFTVVEALVALSIFSLSVTAIAGSFIAIMRIDQKSRAVRVVEENTRFLSEFITREIRNGTIDYNAYQGPVPAQTYLVQIINSEGVGIAIFINGTQVRMEKDIGGGNFIRSDLTGTDVVVSDMNFFVVPSSNPFPGGTVRPRVTFTFTVTSAIGVRASDQATLHYESTVSTREFPQ